MCFFAGPIPNFNMMHFLNLYLTGQNGGENKPPDVDGEPIGGNPKTVRRNETDLLTAAQCLLCEPFFHVARFCRTQRSLLIFTIVNMSLT